MAAALKFVVSETGPKVVLLDPDTGMSNSKPKLEHVGPSEIRRFIGALRPGDCLALYQHSQAQHRLDWLSSTKNAFAACCDNREVIEITSKRTAYDVALFAVRV